MYVGLEFRVWAESSYISRGVHGFTVDVTVEGDSLIELYVYMCLICVCGE